MERHVTYKPPHSTLGMLFSGPKEHGRQAKENGEYRKAHIRGLGNTDGQRSRKSK